MATRRRKKVDEIESLIDAVDAHLAKLPEKWQDHPLAWACRQLALDISICPPDRTHTAVKELRTTMAELRELAPAEARNDGVDEIAARREARRNAAAG